MANPREQIARPVGAREAPYYTWERRMSTLLLALREAEEHANCLGAVDVCFELRSLVDDVKREARGG